MRDQWEQELLQQQQASYGSAGMGGDGVGGAGDGSDMLLGDGGDDAISSAAGGGSETETAEETKVGGGGAGDGLESEEVSGGSGGAVDETKSAKLLALLNDKLPECVNKLKVDEFCTSYCYLHTKNARKRLVQCLIRVPRSRSELTVTYSRIIASLSRIYPDIAAPVLEALHKEFFGMLKTKNQHVDNKLKNVRYLGELVKFRIAPPIVAFRMFRALFGEFSNQNAQLLSVLLETCGRFLYLLPYTHDRMNEVLNTMLRLRRARNLDLHQQTLLEAAYFAVKPPERVARAAKKPLSVVQQYARYLILEKLEDSRASTVDTVIKSLRRLSWKDAEENVTLQVIKASLRVARTKYVSLPNLADCLSGLASYHPNLVVLLVDRLIEELQRALETPYKREIQRCLGLVRLLGELYNFMAVSSGVIVDMLYHLINFGHTESNLTILLVEKATAMSGTAGGQAAPPAATAAAASASAGEALLGARVKYHPLIPCEVDPPTDLFRAQVVCELLNTCGMYYVRGKPKEKLSRYLVYFQRYLLTKQFIPMHVEFTILDTLDSLEEQAREAVRESLQSKRSSSGGGGGSGVFKGRGSHAMRLQEPEVIPTQFPRYDSLEEAQRAVDVFENVTEEERQKQENELENEEEEEDNEEERGGEMAQGRGTTEEEDRGGEDEGEDGGSQDGSDSGSDSGSNSGSGSDSESGSGSESDSGSETGSDDDEDDEEEEALSELRAAKMMEKLRIAEEDDEFEKAFKNVLQVSSMVVVVVVVMLMGQ